MNYELTMKYILACNANNKIEHRKLWSGSISKISYSEKNDNEMRLDSIYSVGRNYFEDKKVEKFTL